MRYLLDTDWVVSFLNGRRAAVELGATLATHGIALSIITLGEIYEGLPRSSDYERRRAQVEAFVANLDLITLSPAIAWHYGRERARLRSQGQLIPDNDIWIAATALAHNLTIVSRD